MSTDTVFPHQQQGRDGLTKRELFAAMAMQGLLVNYEQDKAKQVALWAVEHADALIYALAAECHKGGRSE